MFEINDDDEIEFPPGSLDEQDEQELLALATQPHNDDTHSEHGDDIHCNVCFARAALDMHYGVVRETS